MAERLIRQQRRAAAARQPVHTHPPTPARQPPGRAAAWRAELQSAGVGPAATRASPQARAWLSEHLPHLLAVLGAGSLAALDRMLVARQQLASLQSQRSAIAHAIDSDVVAEREALDQRIAAQRDAAWLSGLELPMDALLDRDVLAPDPATPSAALSREAAFREALYLTLLAHPARLVFEGDGPSPRTLRIEWGPGRRVLASEGGLIHWRHLLQQVDWNLDYQQVLLGEMQRLSHEAAEMARAAGGQLLDLAGRSVGQVPRRWLPDQTVRVQREVGRIGGYVDDPEDRLEMVKALLGAHTACIVVRAPDQWRHVYALEPALKLADLGGSTDASGQVVLRTRARDVQGIEAVRLADGTDLAPSPDGWAAAESKDRLGIGYSLLFGGVIGDFWDDPDAAATVSQILVGVIPLVGQVADARDVAAGLHKLWASGGHDGRLQTLLAFAGLLPLGDLLKVAKRGGRRAMAAVLHGGAARSQERLAQALLQDAAGLARRASLNLPAAREASRELDGGMRRLAAARAAAHGAADPPAAEAAVRQAADAYADTVARWLDASGDNAMAIVVLSGKQVAGAGQKGLGWKRVAEALQAAGDRGQALGERMERWRAQQLDTLVKDVKALGQGRGAGDVVIQRTGTGQFSSDLDVNFLGAQAATQRNAAERLMAVRFGERWRELFDASFLVDPRRLHLFDQLAPGPAARIEARMVKESQANVLARMQNDVYQATASRDPAVRAAALQQGDRLDAQVQELAAAWGVAPAEVQRRAADAWALRDDPGLVRRLELKLDALHGRFVAATAPGERAALAEEIAVLQSRVNTANPDAYLTPGGAALFVSWRDDLSQLRQLQPQARAALMKRRGLGPLSASMKHMAAIDNLAMLHHTELAGSLQAQLKGMAKYSERLLLSTDHVGAGAEARLVERLTPVADARDRFNRLATTMLSIRQNATSLANQATLKPEVERAFAQLQQHLDALIDASHGAAAVETQALVTLDRQKAALLRLALRIAREIDEAVEKPSAAARSAAAAAAAAAADDSGP